MWNIGYNLLYIDRDSLYELLHYAKSRKIKILHIKAVEDGYTFYSPTYQMLAYRGCGFYLENRGTMGLFKYIFYMSKHYLNIIGVLAFFISIFVCAQFIFKIEIIGTVPSVNDTIYEELKDLNVQPFDRLKSYEKLNDILVSLKETYSDKIEYINVYQVGSVFCVEYTKRVQAEVQVDSFKSLYASKDGLIHSFDVDSGLIKVTKNQYVKKGELLVENTIISTSNETKIIPVDGRIYAYTFNQFEASVKNKNQDQADVFYELLLRIRSQIPTDVIIDKENVLQFKRTSSKITLTMHYTFLENIAEPGDPMPEITEGETNEENH